MRLMRPDFIDPVLSPLRGFTRFLLHSQDCVRFVTPASTNLSLGTTATADLSWAIFLASLRDAFCQSTHIVLLIQNSSDRDFHDDAKSYRALWIESSGQFNVLLRLAVHFAHFAVYFARIAASISSAVWGRAASRSINLPSGPTRKSHSMRTPSLSSGM
jgi:hypothetical protein